MALLGFDLGLAIVAISVFPSVLLREEGREVGREAKNLSSQVRLANHGTSQTSVSDSGVFPARLC